MRNKRGITLIALVITIIVLLILAAVSIQAITGDNGIATKAKTAKEQSEIGTEKERIRLSYSSCKLDKIEDLNEEITALELENKMNESYGEETVEVQGSGLLAVKYLDTERIYLVLANGNTVVEADSIVENLTYENSVGIAEDGSLVDMTLWDYEHGYDYSGKEWYTIGGEYLVSYIAPTAYNGEFIEGKIEGKIPAYILDLRFDENFLPVTSFTCVFPFCEELEYMPQIPSTIQNMDAAFFGCENLKESSPIPNGVTDLSDTFNGCKKLIKAPVISQNVINMEQTFKGCTNLIEAPDIPDSVTNMNYTFTNCTNLIKVSKISNNIIDMYGTFENCINLVEVPDIPNGVMIMCSTFSNCESLIKAPKIPNTVIDMRATFSGCISLVESPKIPEKVTDMGFTFNGCISLVTAPDIPKSVTYFARCFMNCENLTGTIKIDANPSTIDSCLENVAINEECNLILTGSSTMLEEILETKSINSNIRIGN